MKNFQHSDWEQIKLVIFDLDGTLYNQKLLRFYMIFELLKYTIIKPDLSIFSIIKNYRRIREQVGEEELFDFEHHLIQKTSQVTGLSNEKIISTISMWIENKPLQYLKFCRYDGLDALFLALKNKGKLIGIFSDYRADKKMVALGLNADFIVHAGDQSVNVLKPHPKGLFFLMNKAGVSSKNTILIGDRNDRDGAVADRANVQCLIKSTKSLNNRQTFVNFYDDIFNPILLD